MACESFFSCFGLSIFIRSIAITEDTKLMLCISIILFMHLFSFVDRKSEGRYILFSDRFANVQIYFFTIYLALQHNKEFGLSISRI